MINKVMYSNFCQGVETYSRNTKHISRHAEIVQFFHQREVCFYTSWVKLNKVKYTGIS